MDHYKKIINDLYNVEREIILLNTIDNKNFEKLYTILNIFEEDLKKIEKNNILLNGFIDRHYNMIKNIKNFLININNEESLSYHDKIIINILKMDKYIPLGITFVFEEFIKGITYFSNEMENKKKMPIYYRAASCGNSNTEFKKKYLECYNDDLPDDIEIKKKHILKCYLERLIYDDMYKNLILHHETNVLNTYQLTESGKNFNSCFLGIELKIEILYDNRFPYNLLVYYIKKGKINNLTNEFKKEDIIKIESFAKITYIDYYGNTHYHDDLLYRCDENNIKYSRIQEFTTIL
jgi:hypothetical protein